MTVKLTSCFSLIQQPRVVGWSESVILNYVDLDTAFSALSGGGGYLLQRLLLFGAGVTNTYNRLTIVDDGPLPAGPTRRRTLGLAGVPAGMNLAGLPFYNPQLKNDLADFGTTVYMVRVSTNPAADPQYVRTFWLAGMPDVFDETNSSVPLPGPLQAALAAYLGYITGGNVLVQAVKHGAGNPSQVVTAYNPVTGFYTVPGHGLTSGLRVVASGFKAVPGSSAPRGLYRVHVIDAANVTLNTTTTPAGFITLGGLRVQSFTYPTLNKVIERGWTKRNKGRPFGLLVGRRKRPTAVRA